MPDDLLRRQDRAFGRGVAVRDELNRTAYPQCLSNCCVRVYGRLRAPLPRDGRVDG